MGWFTQLFEPHGSKAEASGAEREEGVVYPTNIKLGEKYQDTVTGTEGTATGITFFQHGCTRVSVEWADGGLQFAAFDAPRLEGPGGSTWYDSDVVLGKKYRDEQTGVEGIAIDVTFHMHGCERVALEWMDKDGPKEAQFDAPRLTSLETGKKAESERTGGPTRGVSHVRPSAARR